jgi:uncharacterized membrane protein
VINGHVAFKYVYLRIFQGTDRMHKRDWIATGSWMYVNQLAKRAVIKLSRLLNTGIAEEIIHAMIHSASKYVYLRIFQGTDRMHKRDWIATGSWIGIALAL